jgi:hypothetical protein
MRDEKPRIEQLTSKLALWHAYREGRRAKGIDIAQFYEDLAAEEKQRLKSPGAREDFTELCEDGCLQLVLAAIVALFRFSPRLENLWTEMVVSRCGLNPPECPSQFLTAKVRFKVSPSLMRIKFAPKYASPASCIPFMISNLTHTWLAGQNYEGALNALAIRIDEF